MTQYQIINDTKELLGMGDVINDKVKQYIKQRHNYSVGVEQGKANSDTHRKDTDDKNNMPNTTLDLQDPVDDVAVKGNGIRKEYYENGALKSETPYVNGKENGVAKLYYKENGALKFEVLYTDGKINGIGKVYYENGALKSEISYTDGKINGIEKVYYKESGKLKSEIPYTDGKINGMDKEYDENGKIISAHYYVNGVQD